MAQLLVENKSDLIKFLRNKLLTIVSPQVEIVWGLENYVPNPQFEYIVLTPILTARQGTNETKYIDGFRIESAYNIYKVQVDVYGRDSCNIANTINLLFRSDYFSDSGITPLSASDPRQIMMITGEKTMQERWTLDLDISYDVTTLLAQQSATTVQVNDGLIPVDVFY